MMKQYKWQIILSSIVILLPLFAGSFIPLFLFAVHLLCLFVTGKDRKNEEQSQKVFQMIFWICPFLSLYIFFIDRAMKSGMEFGVETMTFLMIDLVFVVIGNYLPKCKQNYTIGIKVPWVYTSEDNWNRTHRFGGKVWVTGGLFMAVTVFLPENWNIILFVADILLMVVVPVLYSYLYYRKEKEEGKAQFPSELSGPAGKITAVFLVAIFIVVAVLMFTGNIEMKCEENAISISADYWEDLTIDYDSIERIEYREDGVNGSRSAGYGSARLLMGTFKNDEFGYYTRYTYTGDNGAIVLYRERGEVVLGLKDKEATKSLYEELSEKIE